MKAKEHTRWSEAKIKSHDKGTIWLAIALIWWVGAMVVIMSIGRQATTGIVLPFALFVYLIGVFLLMVFCRRCYDSWFARLTARRFHHLPIDDDSELL